MPNPSARSRDASRAALPWARAWRTTATMILAWACGVSMLQAQWSSTSRFAVESTIAVDAFRGDNMLHRPNVIVDVTASMRMGEGWLLYVRPWFRQPRAADWDREIYQAALQ